MSEKAKVDKPSQARVNKYGFLAMWIIAQVLGWFLFIFSQMSMAMYLFSPPLWMSGIIAGLIIGIPTALGQKAALYLHFGRWFGGWIRANVLAWVIGGMSIMLVSEQFDISGSAQLGILIQVLSLMLPPTVAQLWVLRRYVQNVWLWLLAAIAASSVFAGLLGQIGEAQEAAMLAFGMYSLVTGLSLLWIMGMQADKGKVANIDTSRVEDKAETDAAETDDVELEGLENRK